MQMYYSPFWWNHHLKSDWFWWMSRCRTHTVHHYRAGLLDGPVTLVSTLLAFGGSSAASLEAQQAGLAAAVVATATSGRDSPVLELSPTGVGLAW